MTREPTDIIVSDKWYDNLPRNTSWASLWHGYVRCADCPGIRKLDEVCSGCGSPIPSNESLRVKLDNGTECLVPQAHAGGEAGFEDWLWLMMLESEWKRSLTEADRFLSVPEPSRPAARTAIVILFWSYFETRINRLIREGMNDLPAPIAKELMNRHGSIGSKLERLYRLLFSSTYWDDLITAGYPKIEALLKKVHAARNRFVHGHPEAIDNAIVAELVESLQAEHESWIAVFNMRAKSAARASL
jgi:hypothetical protein